jgi:nuclear cap-binding protein subunit 1
VRAGDEGSEYFKKDLVKLVDELTDYYLQNRQDLRDAILQYMCEAITVLPLK